MEEPKEQQQQQEPARRASPFQFSLRAMFWLTAGVAVLCSVVFAMPNWAAVPLMLLSTLALPGVVVGLLSHGGHNQTAFAIGAFFPAYALFVLSVASLRWAFDGGPPGAPIQEDSPHPFRMLVLGGLLVTILCGLLSLGVHRAIGRGRGKKRW